MREQRRRNVLFIHWMMVAVFVLAPSAVLAQQDNASQGQNQVQQQHQPETVFVKPEAAQPPAEAAQGQPEDAQGKTQDDGKLINVPGGKALGMSILGNQEAPKALVIVPWKSSELGNVLGISTMLDDSKQPIDKEVFMRMLSYYEIRSEAAPAGAPAAGNTAQPKAVTQSVTKRRK